MSAQIAYPQKAVVAEKSSAIDKNDTDTPKLQSQLTVVEIPQHTLRTRSGYISAVIIHGVMPILMVRVRALLGTTIVGELTHPSRKACQVQKH